MSVAVLACALAGATLWWTRALGLGVELGWLVGAVVASKLSVLALALRAWHR